MIPVERQPDDLRTRIAAAIYKDNGFGWSKYMCEEAADAVIRELNMRQLVMETDTGRRARCYTTEWETDE